MSSTKRFIVALLLLLALAAPQLATTTTGSSDQPDTEHEHAHHAREIREGLERGDQGEEVEDLQEYLAHYGYMRGRNYDRGSFDDATEAALKQLQGLFDLAETGRVDHKTAELLNMPRYDDRPDVAANGDPQVGEFVLYGTSWDDPHLTYAYDRFTSDLSQSEQQAAMAAALDAWAAVTPLTFSEVSMSENPEIVISFESGNHGDGNPFDGPSGVLAHAYYPPYSDPTSMTLHGDAHFDDAETWTVNIPVPGGGIDLETVAIHEFGHSLGLGHSNNSNAIMYAYYGGANQSLHSDDVAGIQALYGSGGGGNEDTIDAEVQSISMSPSSTTVGTAVTGTVEVRNNGDNAASIPVSVSGPSGFSYDETTSSLQSGESTSFTFQWTPASTGNFTLTATAALNGDEDSSNDAKTSNAVQVTNPQQTIDAEVVSASASPTSITQNSGNVTISSQIRNNGSSPATIPVSVSGPNNWSASTSRSLDAGSSTTVQFSWPASVTGSHTFTVWTSLSGDQTASNNSRTTNSVLVNAPQQTIDAEVVSASASPTSITQNSGNVTISSQIRNNGSSPATIPVSVSGPNNWSASTSRTLDAGSSTTVQFSWPASVSGTHSFTVSTSLGNDQNSGNNSRTTNSVTVSTPPPSNALHITGIDMSASPSGGGYQMTAVISIGPNGSAASGAYVYGYWISPQNQYRFGWGYANSSGQLTLQRSTTETGTHRFQVYNVIKSGVQYDSSQNVGNPGSVDVGSGGGTPTIDAGVNNVSVDPTSIALNGGNVSITATIGNNGDNPASVPVNISGPSGFSDSSNVSVTAGSTQQVTFTWPAGVVGTHTFNVSTNLSGDSNSSNNQRTSPSVTVTQSTVVDVEVSTLTRSASSVEQNSGPVTFTANVRNNGTDTASFTVRLNSSTASVNTTRQVSLASGASQNVQFQWNPSVVGSHSFTATAELSGDSNASNNSKSVSLTVTSPPPPPGGDHVFVERIYTFKSGSYWFIYTWVDSTDGSSTQGAVVNATVRAQSGQTKQLSGRIYSSGYTLMYTGPVGSGSHTFTVDDVTLSGYSYEPSLNVITSTPLPN